MKVLESEPSGRGRAVTGPTRTRSPGTFATRSVAAPLAATLALAACQLFSTAGMSWDVVNERWFGGAALRFPFWHVVFSPFCGMADLATCMSLRQNLVGLAYLVGAFILWRIRRAVRRKSGYGVRLLGREAAILVSYVLGIGALGAWVVLGSRPMARLVAADPETLAVDLHSHTNVSWDGRKSFSWAENLRWHEAQGFQAGFITDHNRIEASLSAKEHGRGRTGNDGYLSLLGEEVSVWRQHVVLLGAKEKVDKEVWDGREKLRPFIDWARGRGYVVQLSLPEYWKNHWGPGLDRFFFHGGVHGVEIVNCAPKALDFPPSYRREIVRRCREENLYVAGITDNHGFGSATCTWNLVRIPGWRNMGPDALEEALIRKLREGFGAVRVLTRFNLDAETTDDLLLSPFSAFLANVRSLGPAQAFSWVAWLWFGWWLLRTLGRSARVSDEHAGQEPEEIPDGRVDLREVV